MDNPTGLQVCYQTVHMKLVPFGVSSCTPRCMFAPQCIEDKNKAPLIYVVTIDVFIGLCIKVIPTEIKVTRGAGESHNSHGNRSRSRSPTRQPLKASPLRSNPK